MTRIPTPNAVAIPDPDAWLDDLAEQWAQALEARPRRGRKRAVQPASGDPDGPSSLADGPSAVPHGASASPDGPSENSAESPTGSPPDVPPPVGYRSPPVSGRFRKGQSGNPMGRPRRDAWDAFGGGRSGAGPASGADVIPPGLARALNRRVEVVIAGRPRRLTLTELAVFSLTRGMIAGDVVAARQVLQVSAAAERARRAQTERLRARRAEAAEVRAAEAEREAREQAVAARRAEREAALAARREKDRLRKRAERERARLAGEE